MDSSGKGPTGDALIIREGRFACLAIGPESDIDSIGVRIGDSANEVVHRLGVGSPLPVSQWQGPIELVPLRNENTFNVAGGIQRLESLKVQLVIYYDPPPFVAQRRALRIGDTNTFTPAAGAPQALQGFPVCGRKRTTIQLFADNAENQNFQVWGMQSKHGRPTQIWPAGGGSDVVAADTDKAITIVDDLFDWLAVFSGTAGGVGQITISSESDDV